MASRRFEVTPVAETMIRNVVSHSAENIPLITIENETTRIRPSTSTNTSSQINFRSVSQFLQRRAENRRRRLSNQNREKTITLQESKPASSSLTELDELRKDDLPSKTLSKTGKVTTKKTTTNEYDAYATVQSNSFLANKFLQEIRSKRREIQEKAKNLPIDQRIASKRRIRPEPILRAQDIFSVHFQFEDEEFPLEISHEKFYTEEYQDKIRAEIYDVLNRKRIKQYKKQTRKIFFARLSLFAMTIVFFLMSLILVYSVSQVYYHGIHFNDEDILVNQTFNYFSGTTQVFLENTTDLKYLIAQSTSHF